MTSAFRALGEYEPLASNAYSHVVPLPSGRRATRSVGRAGLVVDSLVLSATTEAQ